METDKVNVRMLRSPSGDLVTVVMKRDDGKELSNQEIVDALCEYLMIFNSQLEQDRATPV